MVVALSSLVAPGLSLGLRRGGSLVYVSVFIMSMTGPYNKYM